MADIEAVALLSKAMSDVRGIPSPPISYGDSQQYKENVEAVVNKAWDINKKVNEYLKVIKQNQTKLRNALKESTIKIQQAISKSLDSINVGSEQLPPIGNEKFQANSLQYDLAQAAQTLQRLDEFDPETENRRRQLPLIGNGQLTSIGNGQSTSIGNGQSSLNILNYVKQIAQAAQKIQRLDEFVLETENVIEKILKTANLTDDDIERLKGYLKSWQEEKHENYEDEIRRIEAEQQKRKEEAERSKTEDEERKLREEEERKKKEEDEKERKRQEEERAREAERQAALEAERLKIEEKERKRREEETRKKREEEEREKKRKAEEEAREAERQAVLEAKRLKKEETERKRREEETRKKREEEERKKKRKAEEEAREAERQAVLEAKRLKKEERERKRREEETRKKREEEEREKKRKAEEEAREAERQAQIEAEQLRIAEEDRLKREEEERMLKEEQARIMREEIERKRQMEEEEARKEAERKRKEKESLEKDRRQKEEEARRKRLDPNNWEPVVYDREDDCVDGNTSYHKGVCCVLASPPDTFTKEDIQCLASDEDDSVIDTLEDGETIASSVIEITSMKGRVKPEAPMRAYIPHCPVTDPGDEIVTKISVNERDWLTTTPELPSPNILTRNNIKLIGVQLDDFDQLKIVAIARRKNQTIIVDRPGTSQYSTYDKNIKLFVPRDAFSEPTELKLTVRPISEGTLSSICEGSDFPDSIIYTSPLITLSCQKPPTKDIEIDLIRPTLSSGHRTSRGKVHHLYRTKDNVWRFAEAEYRGRHNDVSVMLPAYKEKYTFVLN